MATGTVTIHFAPLVLNLEDYDELIGERLAANDVVGLASRYEIADTIKEMFAEGDFDEDLAERASSDRLINKIEISDDAAIEGVQPDEEDSK